MVTMQTLQHGLSTRDLSILEEVGPYVREYVDNFRQNSLSGISLSSHVLTCLIDDGEIEGHNYIGNTLENYNAELASVLAKAESQIPARTNPLAPIDECRFYNESDTILEA